MSSIWVSDMRRSRIRAIRLSGLRGVSLSRSSLQGVREALVQAGAVERPVAQLDARLKKAGYLAIGGQIVDASVIAGRRYPVSAA